MNLFTAILYVQELRLQELRLSDAKRQSFRTGHSIQENNTAVPFMQRPWALISLIRFSLKFIAKLLLIFPRKVRPGIVYMKLR